MAPEPPPIPELTAAPPRRPRLVVLSGEGGAQRAGADGRALVVHVIATRSDAVKLAPVYAALAAEPAVRQAIVHTGQHADAALTTQIFADVGIPAPDHVLGAGGGTPGAQTARAIDAAEELIAELRPAVVVVAGAANSTLGVAISAARLGVPVARLEAGLREGDFSVTEEINRVLLDTTADTLFAPTAPAAARLLSEGADPARVHVVGSTAVNALRQAARAAAERAAWRRFGVKRGSYVLVTLHRPANVDQDERLARIVEALAALAQDVPVIFPVHPRTRERLRPMGDAHRLLQAGVLCAPPLGYVDFLSLQTAAGAVVTDSGTVQEETSALGVRCYTLRTATEREITVSHGTNVLLGDDPRDIADVQPSRAAPTPCAIPYWDGRTAARVARALVANYALVRASAPGH
jgi:UDP-N-acetylglucosamine 2-epimerase (non-hydrolysing)